MVYYDPRKPKPWPIQVMNKLGVTNDLTARRVVITFAMIGIIITVYLYAQILGGTNEPVAAIDPEVLREMEAVTQPDSE